MSLTRISAAGARRPIANGGYWSVSAILTNARARIPGSRCMPPGRLEQTENAPAVILRCRSALRTQANAATLPRHTNCTADYLEGRLDGWQKADAVEPATERVRAPC